MITARHFAGVCFLAPVHAVGMPSGAQVISQKNRSGPKRLQILLNIHLVIDSTDSNTHTQTHARARTHARMSHDNRTEEKVFDQRNIFKKNLKKLTEVE